MRKLTTYILVVISLIAFTVVGFKDQRQYLSAQTEDPGANCPSGVYLTKPYNNSQNLSGIIKLEVAIQSVIPYEVHGVTFFIDGQAVGNGTRNQPYWEMPFDTKTLPNGSHSVRARVHMTDTTNQTVLACNTNAAAISTLNTAPTTTVLEVHITPSNWQGPTNNPIIFKTTARLINGMQAHEVTEDANYEWSTTIGYIKPTNDSVMYFNSGPRTGTGEILVIASYGGIKKEARVKLNVVSADQSTTFPTPTDAQGSLVIPGSGDLVNADSELNRLRQGDAELTSCLAHVFGQEAYEKRIESGQRLGFNDLVITEQCFARRQFVIPVNLAPIKPDALKKLTVSKGLSVSNITSENKSGKDGITLSGQATPNKTLLIYIFSEPLVLATKTDADGKWTYTLDNPLEPGDHEAFVTVEGENAQPVRSGGFLFSVASAAKTDQNPLGLSFSVRQKVDPKYYVMMYAGLGGLAILAAACAIWFIVYRRRGTPTPTPGPDAYVSG